MNGKMLKEIREQPEVLERVLEEGWRGRHATGMPTTWWLPRAATTSRPPRRPP